ncbi:aminoglycoside 6'-N-acetyltransferase [Jannaschia ovalis]|uniref:Aminoglycoside N(6')-acetyltransferase type 1 n=1 Tax=Jannaschia ovalis TaxID=3038773 RepID=A0ABY8LEM4_9RHOB|nr:aminoglycoside 6'-N-acetyltransferase [Jannaschia sp. GRR-S6-38]WGH79764.1 GNAT family N-acetyltransferase [Jannaschia sp. GRR-S6-38]
MPIRVASSTDIPDWIALRARLWPGTSRAEHRAEVEEWLAGTPDRCIVFVAVGAERGLLGFAEAALRHDHVNGCETTPVAFLEGIFVRSEMRGTGIGAALVRSVQAWAIERGCTELASDAALANRDSHAFHAAMGFAETERVVFFRKRLGET